MLAAKSSLALLRAVLKLQPSDGRSGGRVLEFFASQCSGVAKSLVSGVDDRHLQEKILRGGLLAPTERAEDLNLWAGDNRTRYWLRKWHLDAFRNTPAYHSASEALYDPKLVPTRAMVLRLFNMTRWRVGAAHGNPNADEERRLASIAKIVAGDDSSVSSISSSSPSSPAVEAVDASASLAHLSTVELLEAAGCAVTGRSAFNAWCESNAVFEVVTLDYVNALSTYLLKRGRGLHGTSSGSSSSSSSDGSSGDTCRQASKKKKKKRAALGAKRKRPTTATATTTATTTATSDEMEEEGVGEDEEAAALSASADERVEDAWEEPWTLLEIGAGDGRLSHFLSVELAKASGGSSGEAAAGGAVKVVATDSYGWGLKKSKSDFMHVEDVGFERALQKHQPEVVLVSWMPMGVDWTAAIRATPSVKEYILVGETDDGCCGCNWHTWGNPAYAPSVPLPSSSPADFDGAAAADGGAESAPPQPPYVVDGWTRHEVDEPSALQLCRFDSEDFVGNSRTVAFRRK
jgi:hypothetical protein